MVPALAIGDIKGYEDPPSLSHSSKRTPSEQGSEPGQGSAENILEVK